MEDISNRLRGGLGKADRLDKEVITIPLRRIAHNCSLYLRREDVTEQDIKAIMLSGWDYGQTKYSQDEYDIIISLIKLEVDQQL
jgi:hypothetical protein